MALGCAVGCARAPRSDKASSSHKELVVLQPKANDIWTEGESYTIRWRVSGIDRVNVGLALVSGFGLQRSDAVRVRLEDARDPTHFAESPAFTIVAP